MNLNNIPDAFLKAFGVTPDEIPTSDPDTDRYFFLVLVGVRYTHKGTVHDLSSTTCCFVSNAKDLSGLPNMLSQVYGMTERVRSEDLQRLTIRDSREAMSDPACLFIFGDEALGMFEDPEDLTIWETKDSFPCHDDCPDPWYAEVQVVAFEVSEGQVMEHLSGNSTIDFDVVDPDDV